MRIPAVFSVLAEFRRNLWSLAPISPKSAKYVIIFADFHRFRRKSESTSNTESTARRRKFEKLIPTPIGRALVHAVDVLLGAKAVGASAVSASRHYISAETALIPTDLSPIRTSPVWTKVRPIGIESRLPNFRRLRRRLRHTRRFAAKSAITAKIITDFHRIIRF